VHASLHLGSEYVDLLVRRPADRYPKVYRHFAQRCFKDSYHTLHKGESLYQEITPSFGPRHWFVDEPGTYEFQAVYRAPDGRRLASNVTRVRVTLPSPEADREAADFFSTDTGLYLGLEGSRAPQLQKARGNLSEMTSKLSKHTIANQIEIINAACETRAFKDVANRRIQLPDRAAAAQNLAKAFHLNLPKQQVRPDETCSNIRASRLLKQAARAFAIAEENELAKAVIGALQKMLKGLKAPENAVEGLKTFAKQIGTRAIKS
jgi:hypothetical protein